MDSAVIDDLKQFIDRTVVNRVREVVEQVLDEKIDNKLDAKFDEKLAPIHKKIDHLSAFVAEALTDSNDAYDKTLKNHERRITKLERRPI